jgi:hypothetical protein
LIIKRRKEEEIDDQIFFQYKIVLIQNKYIIQNLNNKNTKMISEIYKYKNYNNNNQYIIYLFYLPFIIILFWNLTSIICSCLYFIFKCKDFSKFSIFFNKYFRISYFYRISIFSGWFIMEYLFIFVTDTIFFNSNNMIQCKIYYERVKYLAYYELFFFILNFLTNFIILLNFKNLIDESRYFSLKSLTKFYLFNGINYFYLHFNAYILLDHTLKCFLGERYLYLVFYLRILNPFSMVLLLIHFFWIEITFFN